MPRTTKQETVQRRWEQSVAWWKLNIPSVSSKLFSSQDFVGLQLKAQDDGSVLAIIRAYGSDGAPMVAFGHGFDPMLALIALDATIQGGKWKEDLPWDERQKRKRS